ncbi:hypothetical protein RRG08_028084 [Elysia crispata]|uniref:Uncharacterized protein n=1 Tax=Elysia crispata TaxID=231223 RepID=A0AAE1DY52_9GAST|nr:hypothetical protein RRG08_028084 [Elysia crispata]
MDMNGNIFRSVKRWNTYQFWGIELQDPKLTDAGKYRAVYTSAAAQRDSIFYFDVIMIEPPILKSKRLDVSRKVNNQTGEVTLTCGTIASLGNPPVDVILQIPNGTIIKNSTYENGSYITVLSKDPGKGTFTCKLNDSMTKSCIPQSDLPLWEDNFMHKVARGIGQPDDQTTLGWTEGPEKISTTSGPEPMTHGEVQRVDELRSDSQVESTAIAFLVHLPGFWPVLSSGLFQLWASWRLAPQGQLGPSPILKHENR